VRVYGEIFVKIVGVEEGVTTDFNLKISALFSPEIFDVSNLIPINLHFPEA
jgi:hypothetical protein